MTPTLFLTKAPAQTLLQSAKDAGATITPHTINSPTFRHRAVMGIFPDLEGSKPREDHSILFRLETPATEAPYFLIQSAVPPEPRGTSKIVTKEISLAAPSTGTPVIFTIAINAVRRKSVEKKSGARGYQLSSIPPDHEQTSEPRQTITPWLQDKLARKFSDLQITNHRRDVLSDMNKESGSTRSLQIDTIDGVAVVNDPEALQQALQLGIGRGKAYGCGLLTIRTLS